MKRLILGVAAALMLGAGPAAADGLPSKGHARAYDAVPSWTGFYVGAGVGAGAVVHDLSISQERHYGKYHKWSETFDGIGGEGIFGTVIVGYDRVIRPGWVGGVFLDYDFSDISTDISAHHNKLSLDHTNSWAVGARLGMLTSPSTLWYVTGGYTQAEFDAGGDWHDHLDLTGHGRVRLPTFDGYFLGGGVESILRGNLSLRLEYRFTQLDAETIFKDDEGYRQSHAELEPSMHTARLVLSYKFGHRD